jgi:hypothetical protein
VIETARRQYQRTLAVTAPESHSSNMNKRIVATFLWFNVGWAAGAMATFFLGLPEGLNIALAALLAGLVWFDPIHLLWPQGRRIVKDVPTTHRVAGRLTTD